MELVALVYLCIPSGRHLIALHTIIINVIMTVCSCDIHMKSSRKRARLVQAIRKANRKDVSRLEYPQSSCCTGYKAQYTRLTWPSRGTGARPGAECMIRHGTPGMITRAVAMAASETSSSQSQLLLHRYVFLILTASLFTSTL